MGKQEPERTKKQICMGLLAHVDAGKTTLSEALLYTTNALKKLGRVDHRDAFLDTDAMERERGITIFSKQAGFSTQNTSFTLLDTPGHVDFSAEMERTLPVLDYAVLVISGSDGVQGHTETLWNLLRRYQIPTFLFINKMDLADTNREKLLAELKSRLSDSCVDFSEIKPGQQPEGDTAEQLAMCSEHLMEEFLESGTLSADSIAQGIARRELFPCLFGSALKPDGVEELANALDTYTLEPKWGSDFAARVFKITHDNSGARLTWMKITGGALKAKTVLSDPGEGGKEGWEEKADQLRLYAGAKFTPLELAEAGTVCAVTGLTHTYPGQGLGKASGVTPPVLEPVLTYELLLPKGCDPAVALPKLRQLEEEDPQLHLVWEESSRTISLQLMGEVQLEILKRVIADRFGWNVTFSQGRIFYKETLAAPVEGVGHFEPLRHYAEVHLLMEPGVRGSGLVFDSCCSTDKLDLNWQRLILTHLGERVHRGVLTGSPITDLKITLVAGKAHTKHTEGGDFRQATYRAVRQGLMKGKSVLLEPWYHFRLEVPTDCVGRAMSDVQRMGGTFEPPEQREDTAILTGTAPVSTMGGYLPEVTAYSRGRGRLFCTLQGYAPCHNQEEVIAELGYDPESDLEHTPDSVFCAHGAGTIVPWYEVEDYMHLEGLNLDEEEEDEDALPSVSIPRPTRTRYTGTAAEDKELQAIFEQTYGVSKKKEFRSRQEIRRQEGSTSHTPAKPVPTGPEYLLVDGYNIIFAWDELKDVARVSLDDAREKLINLMANYQGYKKCRLILVFDAYKVKGNPGAVEKRGDLTIVYTKEAETADSYIEKATYELAPNNRVRVATSDGLEQVIILGHGALRQSAQAFRLEVAQVTGEISQVVEKNNLAPNPELKNRPRFTR
jgi:small GTP-binding protein